MVDWSGASVTPRGFSVSEETLERTQRLIGRPLERTLAERKSTPHLAKRSFSASDMIFFQQHEKVSQSLETPLDD